MFFFVHLNAFIVETIEESTHMTILFELPNLECWGLKHSWSSLRHHMEMLGVKLFHFLCITFFSYSTDRYFFNNARISLIRVCMKKLCHSEVFLTILTTILQQVATSTPIVRGKLPSRMIIMNNIVEEFIF